MDLSEFYGPYREDGWGAEAYDPGIMVAVLLYAYCQGIRSSRRIAYVRFHGRNAERWEARGASASERFNYYYTEQELEEWVHKVRYLQEEAGEVNLLFNTNYQDQGVVNARKMAALLDDG